MAARARDIASFLATIVFLSSCGSGTSISKQQPVPTPVPTASETGSLLKPGTWGGTGVQMNVTTTSASLEFDCAIGAIPGPIVLDPEEKFSVNGTIQPGGGPSPIHPPPPIPAFYSGQVSGNQLSLVVTFTNSGQTFVQNYVLTFGQAGDLLRCL